MQYTDRHHGFGACHSGWPSDTLHTCWLSSCIACRWSVLQRRQWRRLRLRIDAEAAAQPHQVRGAVGAAALRRLPAQIMGRQLQH